VLKDTQLRFSAKPDKQCGRSNTKAWCSTFTALPKDAATAGRDRLSYSFGRATVRGKQCEVSFGALASKEPKNERDADELPAEGKRDSEPDPSDFTLESECLNSTGR